MPSGFALTAFTEGLCAGETDSGGRRSARLHRIADPRTCGPRCGFSKRRVAEGKPAIRWLMQRFGRGLDRRQIGIATAGVWILSCKYGDAGVAVVSLLFFGIAAWNERQ